MGREKYSKTYSSEFLSETCQLLGGSNCYFMLYGLRIDLWDLSDFGVSLRVKTNIPGKTPTKVTLKSPDDRLNFSFKLHKDAYLLSLTEIITALPEAEHQSILKGNTISQTLENFTITELLDEVHSRTVALLKPKKKTKPTTSNVISLVEYARNLLKKEVA